MQTAGVLLALIAWVFAPAPLCFFSSRGLSVFSSTAFWGILLGAVLPWVLALGVFFAGYQIAVSFYGTSGEGALAGLWFVFWGLGALWIAMLAAFFRREIPTTFFSGLAWSFKLSGWGLIGTLVLFLLVYLAAVLIVASSR